jgi:hypothetical protein
VTAQLFQDLAAKEDILKKLQATVQVTKQAPSIVATEASTITKSSVVNSLSNSSRDLR